MSDRVSIVAEPRSVVGKKVKRLRREGWIPAVIYGKKSALNVKIENVPLRRALRRAGTTNLIDVQIDEGKRTVLAREIQRHLTRGDLIHVDFLEVDLTERVTAEAQLTGVGQSVPASEGKGITTLALRAVEIECLPEDLLDEIEVDFSTIMTPDDVIYVADLTVPEGVSILTDGETVVARFERVYEEEEEEEEEELFAPAADAVEVIKKGKAEEEEEEFAE
jgi:large subunit ribosomal protein L25